MGSNPISPTTLVFDTSPLQALHRVGLLPSLRAVSDRTLVPRAVFDETQASLLLTAPGRVPNLEEFNWIEVGVVPEADLISAGAVLLKTRRSTQTYRWFSRQIDRPEIEAIILAKLTTAHVVIEDRRGINCAREFQVQVTNVAELLQEFERRQLIAAAGPYATDILATGYYSKELRWLSWGHGFKKSLNQ